MSFPPRPSGKRDRIRGFFGKSSTASPAQTPKASYRTPSQGSPYPRNGSSILADALEVLCRDDQETIHALMSQKTTNIDAAFNQAYARANVLQQRCAKQRWTWEYNGRQISLSDKIDQVVKFLDRFKSVGDIVSNADPVHFGLPWAGIRGILEVALSESTQRAVIITGMELSLLMGNRMKVYLEWYARLNSTPATDNFRRALVSLYAHILRFLACAIQVHQRGNAARLVQHLWRQNDLTNFESQCDTLCARASEEARICANEVGEKWRDSLTAQLQSLDEIHEVHASLVRLHEKANLGKLITAKGATYDSFADGELARCLQGTRTALLEQSIKWAENPESERIFWLCGKAGTGKSTIARTVAQKLDENGLLGASFFFKRGRADRSHADLLFPTIARQLADQFFEVGHMIATALDQDSLLCDKHLKQQFDKLLLQPLQQFSQNTAKSTVVILVIDALDECENSDNIKTILLLLSRVKDITAVQLRIFVTSRPELPVELGFMNMSGDLHHDVRLEKAQESSIAHDIRLFYQHEFNEMRKASLLYDDELPDHWPSEQSTTMLVNRAVPLFIFAFTVARYIAADPERNLATMIQQSQTKSLAGLKGTYLPILDQVVASNGDGLQERRILDFKSVVGSIVLLFDPLSASALACLLEIEARDIGRVLRPLHSVLNIPRTADRKLDHSAPITLFHLSFRDFLIDPDLKDENVFSIDGNETHKALGMHCIRLLQNGGLKKDICGILQPGTRRNIVAKSVVHASLPEAVAYACCYWVQHVMLSGEHMKDRATIHQFLETHLLHWIEALSWLGKASTVVQSLETLKSTVDVHQGKELLALLDDASRFALRNRYIIDEAPLQTYTSALLFAPSRSTIRQMFGSVLQEYFDVMPEVQERWGTEKLKYEGHNQYVTSIALSHDKKILVSGSWDKTIRVWDLATGEERQKLEGHDNYITSVALSQDGGLLVSGSEDNTVRVWILVTGEQRQMLEGHQHHVTAVAVSQDGKIAVSGSKDKTARVWDVATGEQQRILEGHDHCVTTVIVSQDGKSVVSGSEDKTIRIWDLATGEQRQKLEGHSHTVTSVALSQNNLLASGSWDTTIRIWDLVRGEQIQTLEGHDGFVTAIALSQDGKVVVSGSRDKTVRLWRLTTGEEHAFGGQKLEGQKLEGHEDWVTSIALSQDSTIVVSGSEDKTIRQWDLAAGEQQKLEGHNDVVTAIAFSQKGKMVASSSKDKIVRLWNLTTGEKQTFEGHYSTINAVAFSHSSKLLASGGEDKTIRLWDISTGKHQELAGHDHHISTIAFSRDDKMLASGSWDKTIRLWNAATGKHRTLGSHDGTVTVVAFSEDNTTVASGSWDKTIKLWDTERCKETQKHHVSRAVRKMKFSENGNALETDIGRLDLKTGAISKAFVDKAQPVTRTESSWIRRNGVDFLWLPHEFRGASHDTCGSFIAIGQASGAVSLISFK